MRIRGEAGQTRAFTLLEIMVAVAVVAIMMTFLLTIFVGTMRLRRRTEEVTEMNARARAAFDLLRRDLQGAFPLADELPPPPLASPDLFAEYKPGEEFLWRGATSGGYRGLSFFAAVDGSRNKLTDVLWPYEHDTVSWAVRGGSLVREIGQWDFTAAFSGATPPGWKAEGTSPGIAVDGAVYAEDDQAVFVDPGAYAGCAHIRPSYSVDLATGLTLNVTYGTDPLPVTVTLAFEEGRASLPAWAAEYTELDDTIDVDFTAGGVKTFRLYGKACADAAFTLGPNGNPAEKMYFVIIEPLCWSLGESAESLVFAPPPTADYTVANGKGPVPEYVDVTLTISDPEHPTGRRVFGERIWIPAGGGM